MAATKWGICGTGSVCFDFVSAIQLLPPDEHSVIAVASKGDQAKAQKFAEKFGIETTFGSWIELARHDGIDVVYIGTNNSLHYEVCKLMIEAGKNVLCEKPLGLKAENVEELIMLARLHKVFLMEAFACRFFPAYQHIRSDIDNCSINIGKPLHAYIPFCWKNIEKERSAVKQLSKGQKQILVDIDTYTVQLALWIFKSKPSNIRAVGQLTYGGGMGMYENITLEFDEGRVASLHISGLIKTENEAVIVGTTGFFKLPMINAPDSVISAEGKRNFPLPEPKHPTRFTNGSGMVYEIEAVRQCLLRGDKECATSSLTESHTIAQIMDEVRRQLDVTSEHVD